MPVWSSDGNVYENEALAILGMPNGNPLPSNEDGPIINKVTNWSADRSMAPEWDDLYPPDKDLPGYQTHAPTEHRWWMEWRQSNNVEDRRTFLKNYYHIIKNDVADGSIIRKSLEGWKMILKDISDWLRSDEYQTMNKKLKPLSDDEWKKLDDVIRKNKVEMEDMYDPITGDWIGTYRKGGLLQEKRKQDAEFQAGEDAIKEIGKMADEIRDVGDTSSSTVPAQIMKKPDRPK